MRLCLRQNFDEISVFRNMAHFLNMQIVYNISSKLRHWITAINLFTQIQNELRISYNSNMPDFTFTIPEKACIMPYITRITNITKQTSVHSHKNLGQTFRPRKIIMSALRARSGVVISVLTRTLTRGFHSYIEIWGPRACDIPCGAQRSGLQWVKGGDVQITKKNVSAKCKLFSIVDCFKYVSRDVADFEFLVICHVT